MEHFFEYHDSRLDFPWLQEDVSPPVKASAFVSCTQDKLNEDDQVPQSSNNMNINKRMREFLMKTTMARSTSTSTSLEAANDYMENERNRRHMLNERMRREKQRQSYMRLHSLLPSGTKMDKNSIILTAAKKVKELKKYREELERKQSEMNKLMVKVSESNGRENLSSSSSDEMEEAKIRINVAYPSAAVDSMLEVLKCLKQNNSSNVTLIQSKFMPQQFSAILGIQTKIGAAEVEKAVHRTLFEVEKKFRFNRVEASFFENT